MNETIEFPRLARLCAMTAARIFYPAYRAAVIIFILVAASGAYQMFYYQPTATKAWGGDVATLGWSFGQSVRLVHQLGAAVLSLTVAVVVITGMIDRRSIFRRSRWTLPAILGPFLSIVVAQVTAPLLPWDQLGLYAVVVGTNMRGFWVLLGDQVKFALVDGQVIAPRTMLIALVAHAAVAGSLAWGGLAALKLLAVEDDQSN